MKVSGFTYLLEFLVCIPNNFVFDALHKLSYLIKSIGIWSTKTEYLVRQIPGTCTVMLPEKDLVTSAADIFGVVKYEDYFN